MFFPNVRLVAVEEVLLNVLSSMRVTPLPIEMVVALLQRSNA